MKYQYLEHFPASLNDGRHIFVFGSNLAGVHGAGAAKEALLHWGAKRGCGIGLKGFSLALPTKKTWQDKRGLPLDEIEISVEGFMWYAHSRRNEFRFLVTPIGTGRAGYKHSEIAPMFKGCPGNCIFVPAWREFLE